MQPRTLESILASLDTVYNPQIESVRQRQSLIPQQVAEEEKGLQAKQTQAFDDILGGARRRGLGFAGIPLGDQAKYTSTEFLPAMARLRQSGREQAMSLEDAILGINERRMGQGQGIYQFEQSLAEQRRQFDEQQRAAKAAAASNNSWMKGLFGGGQGGGGNPTSATALQRSDKSYAFTDAGGNAISAASYAAAKGIPFRTLLQTMAQAGDSGAKAALGFVGDDLGYDPTKVNNSKLAELYNALVWDTGRKASVYTPKAPGKSYNILSNQGAQNLKSAVTSYRPPVSSLGSGGKSSVQSQLDAARRAGRVR